MNVVQPRVVRSIPACAGEPALVREWFGLCGVYPRVCGGAVDSNWMSMSLVGLSPRVRGSPRCRFPAFAF